LSSTRYYPTDLLLAVEHVERTLADRPDSDLAQPIRAAGLAGLWNTQEFTEGLDELFGGLSQYPWQFQVDSNDVMELAPVGCVVLDDRRAGNTLRGLLLGWATGNEVVIRTVRPDLWRSVIGLLRDSGFSLPPSRVGGEDTTLPADHELVQVPDLLVPEELADEALTTADTAGAEGLRVRCDSKYASGSSLAGEILRLDCRSGWVTQLSQYTYLRGTRLWAAREADAQEEGRITAKLRYVVERARRSKHYRELPSISELADLSRLPILEKETIERHSLPASHDMSTGARPSGEVLRTGATVSEPRFIVYSRIDWNNMIREAISVLYEVGVCPGDRVINTLFGGNLYGGMTTSQDEFSRMPVEAYSTGQTVRANDILMLVRSFSANVIVGMPTLLLPLLRDAKASDPGLTIEKVVYGGSPMMESDKQWLQDCLGTQSISSILAANDGAQLGYQCADLGGTLHHICDDYNLLEVVDEDGRRLPDGEAGDLIITSLQKFEGPLIRYRIGDVGRIFAHKCGCGRNGRVLEYLGRSDGLIKARSRTMLYSDLLAELAQFKVSELQVEVTTRHHKETVIVRTESPSPLDPELVRAHLAERFELLGTVQSFESSDEFFGFETECYAQGELPRNAISGKLRSVIDRRLK
jgi:phenylacetate-coenzyme A ligase PaaK-like adenylate-forming protein